MTCPTPRVKVNGLLRLMLLSNSVPSSRVPWREREREKERVGVVTLKCLGTRLATYCVVHRKLVALFGASSALIRPLLHANL